MMRRRGRRKARWIWAGADNFSLTDGAATSQWSTSAVLPPGRVNWLLDTGMRDSLTIKRILLWMEFHWVSADTAGHVLNDVEFYLRKCQADTTTATEQWAPFSSPTVPSAVTTWSTDIDSDGLDPFMWCHWIKGSTPPNSVVGTYTWQQTGANVGSANQQSRMLAGVTGTTDPPNVCRKFEVTQEWQPDLDLRVMRKLMRDDWLGMSMRIQGFNSGCSMILNYKVRILAS